MCDVFISTDLRLSEWNRLFGGNCGCVYPLAFLHYIFAEETVAFIMLVNLSGPVLTRVSTLYQHMLVMQLHCFCLSLLDYYTLTIRFCFIGLE